MKIQIVRSTTLQAIGSLGPVNRVLSVGDVVELDDLQAQILIAQQDAVKATDKAAKVSEDVTPKTKNKSR